MLEDVTIIVFEVRKKNLNLRQMFRPHSFYDYV